MFQKLKDSKKNPVFMLKHIKDIRSPIAVAQQKHAARKASSVISQDTLATSGHQKNGSTSRNAGNLTVHDPSASTPTLLTPSPNPGWPDGGALSPAVDGHDPGAGPLSAITASHSSASMSASGNGREDSSNSYRRTESNEPSSHSREAPASTGLSYAVAIYPYMAEQDDEFDVVVYVFSCCLWIRTKCLQGRYFYYPFSRARMVGGPEGPNRFRHRRLRYLKTGLGTCGLLVGNQCTCCVCYCRSDSKKRW